MLMITYRFLSFKLASVVCHEGQQHPHQGHKERAAKELHLEAKNKEKAAKKGKEINERVERNWKKGGEVPKILLIEKSQ